MRILPILLLLAIPAFTPAPAHAADRSVAQEVRLPSGPFPFTAAIETIRLADPKGVPVAEIVTSAFLGTPPSSPTPTPTRPVTFVFNGGPGAASAWLSMGAVGPWRVTLGAPSHETTLIDNTETWLTFTDLVFIDPVGTGYSRVLGDEAAQRPFLAVDSDIDTLATVARRWLEAHGRMGGPVFLLGESYGGFRAPRLARALLDKQGVGVRGLVLISPVLDFNGRDAPYDPLRWAARLPAIVAGAKAARSRGDLTDAEDYARGAYVTDLMRGPRDAAAQQRIADRLATLTGLDATMLRRREGKPDLEMLLRVPNPAANPGPDAAPYVASPYDSTIHAADPFPGAVHDNSPDVVLDGLRAPVTAGILSMYHRLGWQPEGAPARQYNLLNEGIARSWDYGRGNVRPESMTALRQFLALDPSTRVMVAHGLTDLVTPYFATALLLDQVPETAPPGRLTLRTYPGGHMMYTQDRSRMALEADAAEFYRNALAAPTATGAPATTP